MYWPESKASSSDQGQPSPIITGGTRTYSEQSSSDEDEEAEIREDEEADKIPQTKASKAKEPTSEVRKWEFRPLIWAQWALLYLCLHSAATLYHVIGFIVFYALVLPRPGIGLGFAPFLLNNGSASRSFLRGFPGLSIHPHDPDNRNSLHLNLDTNTALRTARHDQNQEMGQTIAALVGGRKLVDYGSCSCDCSGESGCDRECRFGWERGRRPCFLLTLNRVFGWSPPHSGSLRPVCTIICCKARKTGCKNCTHPPHVTYYPSQGLHTDDIGFPFRNEPSNFTQPLFFIQPDLTGIKGHHFYRLICDLTLNGVLMGSTWKNEGLAKLNLEVSPALHIRPSHLLILTLLSHTLILSPYP